MHFRHNIKSCDCILFNAPNVIKTNEKEKKENMIFLKVINQNFVVT